MIAPLPRASHSTRWLAARLRAGLGAELELRGFSMTPGLRDGDHLQVAPLGERLPSPGEILVARLGTRLVTHRLVAVAGGRATLRGDACRRDDPPIETSSLLGRVVAVRRGPLRLSPPPRGCPAAWRRALGQIREWLREAACR
ncbi:MAG TPA: S24/S26 family peptidase [Kofleriaceae bacterium]|nr:S24/S26 family peptidase [Kofleriaceae bacterium]